MDKNGARFFHGGKVTVWQGDSRDVLSGYAADSFDSVVTDPPYALVSIVKRFGNDFSNLEVSADKDLSTIKAAQYKRLSGGFMGQKWDTGETAFAAAFWAEVLRVLKPGGHILAFSGTRTYHRLACAIEDAGFEIRDMVSWIYGSGFPKSHDVSKGIDRAAGAEREVIGQGQFSSRRPRATAETNIEGAEYGFGSGHILTAPATDAAAQWSGWGTALKPASEPIVLARKPLIGTVAANVLKHGTGAINVDGCRVGIDEADDIHAKNPHTQNKGRNGGGWCTSAGSGSGYQVPPGRWPANVIHDGSEEVIAGFPETAPSPTGLITQGGDHFSIGSDAKTRGTKFQGHGDSGSAARFFYTSKADSDDRIGSKHPTVKPVDLMRYLCRLITPPGGMVLDPFAGTGTTGEAAFYEGFRCTMIEREAEYMPDIERRMALCMAGPEEKAWAIIKAKGLTESPGPLFE